MCICTNNMVYTGRPQADWEWGVWGGAAPPTKGLGPGPALDIYIYIYICMDIYITS